MPMPGAPCAGPFKPILLELFGLGQGWRTFLRARAELRTFFGEIISLVGKLIFLAPYFRLSSDV